MGSLTVPRTGLARIILESAFQSSRVRKGRTTADHLARWSNLVLSERRLIDTTFKNLTALFQPFSPIKRNWTSLLSLFFFSQTHASCLALEPNKLTKLPLFRMVWLVVNVTFGGTTGLSLEDLPCPSVRESTVCPSLLIFHSATSASHNVFAIISHILKCK